MTISSQLDVFNFIVASGTVLTFAFAIFASLYKPLRNNTRPALLTIVLSIMAVGLIGAPIVYQYYFGFPACTMCWYQRIFMWPIGFMILGTLLPSARAGRKHVLSALKWLAPAGLVFSIWHYISQWGLTSTASACGAVGQSVSCDGIDVIVWGFMTIPAMAGLGFISLFLLIRVYTKN